MKHNARTKPKQPMSPDAYAGFLKLWITPTDQIPQMSTDVDAYLTHISTREPLSAAARRALKQPTRHAA